MTFLWPDALWLVVVVPVLTAAYLACLRRRHWSALRHSSVTLVRTALDPHGRIRRHVPAMLFLASIVAVVLASGRPAVVIGPAASQRTVILAIDASASMQATDIEPSRFAVAQAAAKSVIRWQPRDVRVGVVAFGYHADLVQSPTTNHSEVLKAIDTIEMRWGSGIGTGLMAALILLFPDSGIGAGYDIFAFRAPEGYHDAAGSRMRQERRDAHVPAAAGSNAASVIVLVTDGHANTGFPTGWAARMAAERGVRVHTVGVGTAGGGVVNFTWGSEPVGFDAAPLQEISGLTHGEYFHAGTAKAMDGGYEGFSARVAFASRDREITVAFVAVATLLLLASAVLSLLWFNRLDWSGGTKGGPGLAGGAGSRHGPPGGS